MFGSYLGGWSGCAVPQFPRGGMRRVLQEALRPARGKGVAWARGRGNPGGKVEGVPGASGAQCVGRCFCAGGSSGGDPARGFARGCASRGVRPGRLRGCARGRRVRGCWGCWRALWGFGPVSGRWRRGDDEDCGWRCRSCGRRRWHGVHRTAAPSSAPAHRHNRDSGRGGSREGAAGEGGGDRAQATRRGRTGPRDRQDRRRPTPL